MKKTIGIIKSNKFVGYWNSEHSSILTRTIELWDPNEEGRSLPTEFFRASTLITKKYSDPELIPVIVLVSTGGELEPIRKSAEMHLQNMRDNWPYNAELIRATQESINKITAL